LALTMPETPEQKARREIDAKLTASGWLVQDRDELDLTAGRGLLSADRGTYFRVIAGAGKAAGGYFGA